MAAGGVVVFNYCAWIARYPEFASLVPNADLFFAEAELYCNNTAVSPITSLPRRTLLLNMLTAHIAALYVGVNGVAASQVVGQVASASEGSISISVNPLAAAGTQAWYAQTKYGASFWAATMQNRTMRYLAGSPRAIVPRGQIW